MDISFGAGIAPFRPGSCRCGGSFGCVFGGAQQATYNERHDIAATYMLEHIKHQEDLLAIIVRNDFAGNGVHFFTPDEFSQQLAYMRHPQGKLIEPHIHNIVPRNITYTQEVLIIKRGRLRVDFYDRNRTYY